jgi:hypothetical protein
MIGLVVICWASAVSASSAPCYNAAMSTPIVTARRKLVERISNLLRNEENALTPWQLKQVQEAIEQVEEERFPDPFGITESGGRANRTGGEKARNHVHLHWKDWRARRDSNS